ncbi:hypothetical protein Scep_024879 [Stephania cephalantha]|uniref:Uncharacterized protein n=1 Tax=Stephania cephalantha TaxID=152367 RepID=A0AAP0EY35_9MAGN
MGPSGTLVAILYLPMRLDPSDWPRPLDSSLPRAVGVVLHHLYQRWPVKLIWGVEGDGGEGEVDEGEDSGVGGDGEGDCYLRFTWWKARTEEAHIVERANRGGRTEEAHTVERVNRGGVHGGERGRRRRTTLRGRTEEAHTVDRANG